MDITNIETRAKLLAEKIIKMDTEFRSLKHNDRTSSEQLCVQASQNISFIFREQMKKVATECTQNYYTLANILCELEIASNNKMFHSENTFEILENAKKLLNNLEATKQKNRRIKKDIVHMLNLISEETTLIDNNIYKTARNIMHYVPISAAVALHSSAYPNKYNVRSMTINVIAGTIFTGALVTMFIYDSNCKDQNPKTVSECTKELFDKMYQLQQLCIEFISLIKRVIEELINFIQSAEKNVTYCLIDGYRVSVLTQKMIEETKILQSCFLLVESKARKFSKKYLILNN